MQDLGSTVSICILWTHDAQHLLLDSHMTHGAIQRRWLNQWLCNLPELHIFEGIQYSFLLQEALNFQT